MPQVAVLSPFLFSLFVADLQCVHQNSKVTKFADDTTLLTKIKNIEQDIKILQLEMENIFHWSALNIMSINAEKSKILYFKRSNINLEIVPNCLFDIKNVKY